MSSQISWHCLKNDQKLNKKKKQVFQLKVGATKEFEFRPDS